MLKPPHCGGRLKIRYEGEQIAMTSVIEVRGLAKSFGDVQAVVEPANAGVFTVLLFWAACAFHRRWRTKGL